MRSGHVILCVLGGVTGIAGTVSAQPPPMDYNWYYCPDLQYFPPYENAFFCETFDGYSDNSALWDAWPPVYAPGTVMFLETQFVWSMPHSARTPCGNPGMTNPKIGLSSSAQIQAAIRGALGSDYVMGTDANPLTLYFTLDVQNNGKVYYGDSYVELSRDGDHAPTDYVLSDDCGQLTQEGGGTTSCGEWGPFPIVCQQATQVSGCPPIGSAPSHNAIALGLLAYTDPNPCHCDEDVTHAPQAFHPMFFDGRKWITLKNGVGQGAGDFSLYNKRFHYFTVTIKSNSIRIDMQVKQDPARDSWVELQGAYTGPFNKLHIGANAGCPLNSGSWSCAASAGCLPYAPVEGAPAYDNLFLDGGEPYSGTGACCLNNATCLESESSIACQAQGGLYQGSNTTCSQVACCPLIYVDADNDGTVDMTDFAVLQRCITTGGATLVPACKCFDRNGSNSIDEPDVELFATCANGPGVPGSSGTAGDPPVSCKGPGW